MVHGCPGKCHHEVMDLKPVTRTSVLGAVALWAFYCLIVVVVLPMLFAWSGRTITVLIMIVLVAAVVGGVLALRPRSAEGADYIITSYGARSQGELTVPVPVSELPGLVEETCRQDGELRLRELDARGGRISVGMTFSSWGDRARFTFHPLSENESRITATSRPLLPITILGGARSERNLSLLFHGVAREAESARTNVA